MEKIHIYIIHICIFPIIIRPDYNTGGATKGENTYLYIHIYIFPIIIIIRTKGKNTYLYIYKHKFIIHASQKVMLLIIIADIMRHSHIYDM